MTLPTQKWKIRSPSDSSHVVVTECQLNHFMDLPVLLLHSHTGIASFMVLLPHNTAENPTTQRHRDILHRDRQLTQNALFTGVHLSLVKISEGKTHSTRTQVIYVTLIKNVWTPHIAAPACNLIKHMAWQRQLKYDAPFHQSGLQKLKQSYCVKSSLLQK